MYSKQIKNKNNIYFYKQNEISLKVNKFLVIYLLNIFQTKNKNIKNLSHILLYLKMHAKNISKTKLNRTCIQTQRSRAIYRPYGLSRCALKELIIFGKLPGYQKSIW